MRIELYAHMRKMGMFVNKSEERRLKRTVLSLPADTLEQIIMKIRSEPTHIPEL